MTTTGRLGKPVHTIAGVTLERFTGPDSWQLVGRGAGLGLVAYLARPPITNDRGKVTTRGTLPTIRLTGPVVGAMDITDPATLRHEARRLEDAAAVLAALIDAGTPPPPTGQAALFI